MADMVIVKANAHGNMRETWDIEIEARDGHRGERSINMKNITAGQLEAISELFMVLVKLTFVSPHAKPER